MCADVAPPTPPSYSVASCTTTLAAALSVLLSALTVVSFGVIAGGTWWTAQAMHRLTDRVPVAAVLCTSDPLVQPFGASLQLDACPS